MNELRTLLALELRSLYGINKARFTKDQKAKNRYHLLIGAWVILILMVFGYVAGLVYGLCALGLGEIVPAYLVMIASLLILAFGIFTAGSRIFGKAGYDILASLPVKPGSIVVSRFLSLYAEDLVLTLVILLPGLATYGICWQPGLGVYLVTLLGAVFLPAIPLVISTLFGTAIFAVTSRMKHKNLMQTVLTVAFVVVILIGSFSVNGTEDAGEFDPEILTDLAKTVGDLIGKVYPPALWLGNAMADGDLVGLALLAGVSAAVFVLTVLLVSRNFHRILGRLRSVTTRQDYKIGAMESRSLLKALYVREVKRYFSSSIYVTNTIVGPVLAVVMSVGLWVSGTDALETVVPGVDIVGLLPFVLPAVMCMMTTTSVSVSMEGRQFWVIKALPIPTRALLDSKLLLNLTLLLPAYILAVTALALAAKPGLLELFWLTAIPAAMAVFCLVFGITVNLKFHSFDWEKEETVVKQSLSAALGGFAGPLVAVAGGAAVFFAPDALADVVKALLLVLLLGAAVLLYRWNNRAELNRL